MAVQETTDGLGALHRGEIAATETYQQALAKVGDEPWAAPLRKIHAHHREAANLLRQYVRASGNKPDQGSGAWGEFAKAVEGVAKVFGNSAALKALKEGEEHGMQIYEDALLDPDIIDSAKALIRSELLPQTRAHIAMLEGLMKSS